LGVGHEPRKEGNHEPAAQRPKRRRCEISDRWVPSGREVLEVFQNGGVHPKSTNYLHTASGRAVPSHSDRSRSSVGNEMLKLAGEPGSYHLLRRQQRQDSE
jgi:hypothetical protein